MATWCLPQKYADEFLEKLRKGEIDPAKLAEMTSAERRAFFSKIVGEENAKNVNALFESKLLLKNQKAGMVRWAKKIGGMTEPAKRDIISRINKMDKFLNTKEEQMFLEDLASQKLGISVTQKEAQKIFDMTSKIKSLEKMVTAKGLSKKEMYDREVNYGNELIDFAEYMDGLRPKEFKIGSFALNVANLPQSVMTSLDMSAPRQLWGLMSTGSFWKNTPKLVTNWFSAKSARNDMAGVMGSPYYKISQAPSKNKLIITSEMDKMARKEDDVMSAFVDKIPILKQSSRSFRGMINATRMSRFKTVYDKAKKRGENVDPKTEEGKQTIEDINRRINIFSARGSLGKGDKYQIASPFLNVLFWSVRKMSADILMLNPMLYLRGSKTARNMAFRALIGSTAWTAGILVMADQLGYDVELDPRSADFGKIKIGDERVDVTAGKAPLIRLLVRLGYQAAGKKSIKSTTTGRVFKAGEFHSPKTLLLRYGKNKLAPMAGAVGDLLSDPDLFEGKDFIGRKIDLKKLTLENLGKEYAGIERTKDQTAEWVAEKLRPMIISTIMDMAHSGDEKDIISILTLFEIFGYGVQTYD